TSEITGTHLDARCGGALVKKPGGHIHLTQGGLIRGAKMLAENEQAPGMVAVKVTEHDLLNPREIDAQMQHIMEDGVFFEAGIKEHRVLLALKERGKAPLTQTT